MNSEAAARLYNQHHTATMAPNFDDTPMKNDLILRTARGESQVGIAEFSRPNVLICLQARKLSARPCG